MLKYVIFDLDDTLLDFSRGEHEGLTYMLKKYGLTDIQHGLQVYQTHNHWVWAQIEQGADPQPLLNQRFAIAFKQLGLTVNGPALQREYNTILAHNFYTIPGATQLLTDLQAAGLTLLVGTNGVKTTQLSRIQGSGLAPYFQQVFISADLGVAKPDPRFFAAIFTQNPAMTAENTIMVGDNLASDIYGATQAHLKNIWYNPQQLPNPKPYQPTATVTNYQQLEHYLLH